MTLVLLHFTARLFSGLHAPSSDFITLPVHEHSKYRVRLKYCCESFYDSIYLTHVRKGVVFCVYECVSLFCVSLSLSENIYVCLLHIICACALHNTSRLLPRFLCLYDGRWRPARLVLALRTLLASLCAFALNTHLPPSRVPKLTCIWMSGASGLGNLTTPSVLAFL